MAYYNEIFIEENGKLIHVGSCTGSNTPEFFDEVKNLNDWNLQLKALARENGFYAHSSVHPFPWKTYKTSDNLIVFRKRKKKWYEFWKPSHEVLASADKHLVEDDNKCSFINISKWSGDADYNQEDLIVLDLPLLKR